MLERPGFRSGCLRTENVDANERQWNYRQHPATALAVVAGAAPCRFPFPVTWSSLPIKSGLACGPAGMSYGGGPGGWNRELCCGSLLRFYRFNVQKFHCDGGRFIFAPFLLRKKNAKDSQRFTNQPGLFGRPCKKKKISGPD